jgi:DNA-binding response OmpR family regulator
MNILIVEDEPQTAKLLQEIILKTPVKLPETLVVSRLKVTEFMQWMER